LEPSTNSGGGEGPGSVGGGLNTSQPAAPLAGSSHAAPDASSAGQMAQAASGTSGAGMSAASMLSSTSATSSSSTQSGSQPPPGGSGGNSGSGSSGSGSDGSGGNNSQSSGPNSAAIAATFGQLALPFELNSGQSAPSVVAVSNGPGFGFWLKNDNSMTFRLPPDTQGGTEVFAVNLLGSSGQASIVPGDQLTTRANYFVGQQGGSGWVTDVAQYSSLTDQNVYPNIDLVLHSRSASDRTFEYDYDINPGGDLSNIHLGIAGVQGLQVDEQGRLLLETPGGNVAMDAPVFYQTTNGLHHDIAGSYVLYGDGTIGFQVTGKYVPSQQLVLDPALSYASYAGGSGDESAYGVAVDNIGSLYVTGGTTSSDFPVSLGYSSTFTGTEDAFVFKLVPDGSSVVYSTYVGGTTQQAAHSIAVNAAGEVAIAGVTNSSDFPTTSGAYDTCTTAPNSWHFLSGNR
jgi:hypothetical protein